MEQLILLEDLGYIYPKETSTRKEKFGLYRCYCGNEFRARTTDVKRKKTISCSCYNKQRTKEVHTKHGFHKHRLYSIWAGIIQRCTNKNGKDSENYANRGITVCDEWLNIGKFIDDMYPTFIEGLSIDRIDNNKGYSKENCRWATSQIQGRNTRILQKNNTSGYRGVHFDSASKKWKAQITINSKVIRIGYFNTALEAAKAYDYYVLSNNLEHTINGVEQ